MLNQSIFRGACARRLAALLGAMLAAPTAVIAGPPLVTDDPGILDPGQWELIGAVTYTESSEGSVTQLPLLDVSYGVTPNVQVTAVYSYAFVNPDQETSDDNFGNPVVGAKWRFWDGERLQMAIGGAYLFGISLNAAKRGVGDDEDLLFVPILVEYSFDHWRINAELGYASIKNEQDGLGYGVAVAFPVGSRTELLAELYGGSDTSFDDDVLNYRVGVDFAWREDLHVLFGIGSGLSEPDGEVELDYDVFLGLQYFR